MDEVDTTRFKAETDMEPCWLVWEAASDGGRPYLIAIDTSEEQANLHVHAKREEARMLDRPPPMLKIEESWLDHLYGESMAKSFDEAKKMAREVMRAQIAELQIHLSRAITIGQEAYRARFHDFDDAQERLDDLAKLEGILPKP